MERLLAFAQHLFNQQARQAGVYGILSLLVLIGTLSFTNYVLPIGKDTGPHLLLPKSTTEAKTNSKMERLAPESSPVKGGRIRISEYMYQGTQSSTGEFIELTNPGDAAVNMNGWSFDDNDDKPGKFSLSGFGRVLPGESVIITEINAEAFRTAWNLGASIKIIGDNTEKLGSSDHINIYDSTMVRIDYIAYTNSSASGKSKWATQDILSIAPPYVESNWKDASVNDLQRSYLSTPSSNTANPGRYSYRTLSTSPLIQATQTTPYIQLATYSPGFVSGVLNDPTDPVSTLGTSFSLSDPDTPVTSLVVSVSSNNAAVVPSSSLTLTGSGATRGLKIVPVGVGYATISVMVSDGSSSDTYVINYAVSAASQTPATTRFHAGTSDGSTAINIDTDYMLVGDDENQTIRLYSRRNSGTPIKGFDFTSVLNLTDLNSRGLPHEVDIEGSIRTGNRIFWIGSQSNNDQGEARTNRNRVFVTNVGGTGASTSLSYGGRYDYLRDDLLSWDAGNKHGKGANYYGFVASAAPGVNSKQAAGYNIEGLELAPDNTTGYICFRAPLTPTNDRYKALIVPVTNFTALVTNTNSSLPAGSAKFGAPIEMDLGGRGIREMRKNSNNEYLIVAGPPGDATGVAPKDFKLYTWNGDSTSFPNLRDADLTSLNVPGSFEGIAEVTNPLSTTSPIQFLMDNGVSPIYYNDGVAAKDFSQPLFKKFRSEIITPGGETPPPLAWQKTLGGTGSEGTAAITPTSDGGYVLVGSTVSNDGDVSGNHGGVDAWIVKVNSVGSIVWQKAVGGTRSGSYGDVFQGVATTSDGYVATGITYSNDGDVSGNHGGADFWIVKFNLTGDIVWKKVLGGDGNDWGFGVTVLKNGDIVAAGTNGNFYVVKLSNSGDLIWEKTVGGIEAFAITATDDNGVIMVGYGYGGSWDYSVVKLSSAGDVEWQKTLGGSDRDFARAVTQTKQGDFLIAGRSKSNNGDVTGNHGDDDFWVVKLNRSGQLLWQKSLGGSAFDEAYAITNTTDGGCVVSGFTRSIDGDVTGNHGGPFYPNDGSFDGSHGREDAWLVKLNSSGGLVWQKTYGGTGSDSGGRSLLATSDGGYLLAGSTNSTDGDVSGTRGQEDFWVVKLGPTPRSAVSPPAQEPLSLLAPIYDCQTKTLTFRTKGGDGSSIEFSAAGVTDWSTSPNQQLQTNAVTSLDGASLLLKARQNGQTASYAFNASVYCGDCDFSSGPRNLGTWNGLLVQIRTISGHNVLVTADPNSTTDKYYPRGDNFWGSFALDSSAIALKSCLNAGTTTFGGLTEPAYLRAPSNYKQGTEADGAIFFAQDALPQNPCDVSPRHVGTWNGLNVEIRSFANGKRALITAVPGASNDKYYVRGDNFWDMFTKDGSVDQYRFCLNAGTTAWYGLSLPSGIVPPPGYQQGLAPDGAIFFAQNDANLQSLCDVSPRRVGTWNGLNVEIRSFANGKRALITAVPGASNDKYYVRGDNFWDMFTKDVGAGQYRFCLNAGTTAWYGLSLPNGIVPPPGYQQGLAPDGAIYFSINGLRVAATESALDESALVYMQPNPAQDVITVTFILKDAGDVQLRLLDLQGRVQQARIEKGLVGKNERTLRIGSLSTGLYILEVTLNSRRVILKLLKE